MTDYASRLNQFNQGINNANEHAKNIRDAIAADNDPVSKALATTSAIGSSLGDFGSGLMGYKHLKLVFDTAKNKASATSTPDSSTTGGDTDTGAAARPADPNPDGAGDPVSSTGAGDRGTTDTSQAASDAQSSAQQATGASNATAGGDTAPPAADVNDVPAENLGSAGNPSHNVVRPAGVGEDGYQASADSLDGDIIGGASNRALSSGIIRGASDIADQGASVSNMAQGAAQAAGSEIAPAFQGIKQGLTAVASKVGSAVSSASDAIGGVSAGADGLLAAAPELGPLAPVAAVIGGLMSLGTTIASATHKTPTDTTPAVQSVGANMSMNHPDPNSQSTIY